MGNVMNRRHILLTGAASGLLSACGIHKKNRVPITRERNIPIEGGIGGTGIVGFLDEFGSLIVNNHRIQTDNDTRYSDAYGWISASSIEIGDSLTIEAKSENGEMVAKRVQVLHPVIGVISLMSSDGRLAQINGIYVDIPKPSSAYKVGDRVAVSGAWFGNRIIAHKIAPARRQEDVISGEVTYSASLKPPQIGSTRIQGVRNGAALTRNTFVIARGKFDMSRGLLQVNKLRPGRFTGDAGSLTKLSVDGYLVESVFAPGIKISGLGHSLSRNVDLSNLMFSRVLLEGAYSGTFRPSMTIAK